MSSQLIPIAGIIGAVVVMAVLGAVATDTRSRWYHDLDKPEWQPPAWVFAPVWLTIYALLATSTIIVWNATAGPARLRYLTLYALSGVLNLAWSFLFFRARSAVMAGIDIIGLLITIILIIIRVWPIAPLASLLLVPYLLWVAFASILNWTIVQRNPIR